MPNILHITNGDSAANTMSAGGIPGEILSWRDVLHEGPVPAELDLDGLSAVRADWLTEQDLGGREELNRSFRDRDAILRRYTDFDELVLWFEWDLYDQFQLIQILDFLAGDSKEDREETGTGISIVSFAGYLGTIEAERFADLLDKRVEITQSMLDTGRRAWNAVRSPDPHDVESVAMSDNTSLEFLNAALWRHLEEFPSSRNGLSRSEQQVLEAVAHGPLTFSELFKRVANREDRIFCGDTMIARYIERMSLTDSPLIVYPSGDRIDAPKTEEDSRAFRNAEMVLTALGREVLRCEKDWIALGGSDRWLGGVHLTGATTPWRWDPDSRRISKLTTQAAA